MFEGFYGRGSIILEYENALEIKLKEGMEIGERKGKIDIARNLKRVGVSK